MSLDFKNIGSETYLALISRDGQLTVCEPVDHDSLSDWQIMWQDYLCKTPPRTEETSFRLCWHHEKLPAWPAVLAGLDRKSLSLAVAVMDTVRVYRTDKDRKFFTAAELTGSNGLVRDVSWANGSMRGYDLIAAASKDGHIRLYELHTANAADLPTSTNANSTVSNASLAKSPRPATSARPAKSGIGAGLAGGSGGGRNEEDGRPGKVVQQPKLVAELTAHEGAVWRVTFSQLGRSINKGAPLLSRLTNIQVIYCSRPEMMVLSKCGRRVSTINGFNTLRLMRLSKIKLTISRLMRERLKQARRLVT